MLHLQKKCLGQSTNDLQSDEIIPNLNMYGYSEEEQHYQLGYNQQYSIFNHYPFTFFNQQHHQNEMIPITHQVVVQTENNQNDMKIYRLHKNHLHIVSQYFDSIEDFINLEMGVKACRGNMERFKYNPVSV